MREEYESFHDITGQPVVGGQSSSSFVPSVIKREVPLDCDDFSRKDLLLCNNMENELKSCHDKTNLVNFVWMQDFWMLLKSVSIPWQKTLQNSHNLQIQWPVVGTLCQETKKHRNQKVGSKGTPQLDPYWKLQLVSYKVNMERKSELNL